MGVESVTGPPELRGSPLSSAIRRSAPGRGVVPRPTAVPSPFHHNSQNAYETQPALRTRLRCLGGQIQGKFLIGRDQSLPYRRSNSRPMRLNVLILVGVFALLAAFYSRQQHAQGMPAGVAPTKVPTSAQPVVKSTQPAPVPQPSLTAEKPQAVPEKSAPVSSAPTPENKPTVPATKPPVVENKPPTPDTKPPAFAAKPPAPEEKPTPPLVKPPVRETKPTPPPAPSPAKVAPKSSVAIEKLGQSKVALKQIVQALQNYFRDTKRYPTDLQELLPKYLGAIPLNPCTSQPYYYIPVNTPPTSYILTSGRFPSGSLCRSVSQGFSYTTETGMQDSP